MTVPLGLARRTLRGGATVVLGTLVVRGATVILMTLLARLVSPADYGAVVVSLALFGGFEAITNPALSTVLLREPALGRSLIDTAFVVGLARGVVLMLALWLCAPALATFFGSPAIEAHLQLLAIALAVAGTKNPHTVTFARELRYLPAFVLDNVAPFTAAAVGAVGLLVGAPGDVLIAATVAGAAASSLASWAVPVERPRLKVQLELVVHLWRQGRWWVLQGALVYALLNLDGLVVGRFMGIAAAGIYALGHRGINLGVLLVTAPVSSVLNATFSRLQDDASRVARGLTVAVALTVGAAAAFGGFTFVVVEDVLALLEPNGAWTEGALVARALLPFVVARALNATLAPVAVAQGQTRRLNLVSALQLALLLPAFWWCAHHPAPWRVALAVSMGNVGAAVALLVLTARSLSLPVAALAAPVVPPLLFALVATVVGAWASQFFPAGLPRIGSAAVIIALAFGGLWQLCFSIGPTALRPPISLWGMWKGSPQ